MNQHFANAKDPVKNGKLSDSFAKHFASHFENKKTDVQRRCEKNY